ncbi:MAG: OPT/YSL family transporter [Myxococcales bacterium]|nr:OPT/YSL family transporter [Myxococcales bacterium]
MTQKDSPDTLSKSPQDDYPPLNLLIPQLTIRSILTGMVLGGVLSLCNIYAGLKIGWGFNMSVTAALLSFGFWEFSRVVFRTRKWNILENNLNQTAASAAASISSAGLVAPIPAWTILTGQSLPLPVLMIWVISVSMVGVVVAIGLRQQMLITDKLPFPGGIATAETLKEMYAKGREALARVLALLTGGAVATTLKLFADLTPLPKLAIPGVLKSSATTSGKITLNNLGFALDPSLLMVGVGALIGMRACVSLLIGAIIGWIVIGHQVLEWRWVVPGPEKPDAIWFKQVVEWLLWPGVSLMVVSSLTSFAFSWKSIVRAMRGGTGVAGDTNNQAHTVPRRIFLVSLALVLIASVVLQNALFGIGIVIAAFGVVLSFVLAIVAGRVSGEAGITPVGAMGKVTQLIFGIMAPSNVSANLMAANVTGGAASQCADLLHDMKTGLMIGASPRFQAIAQTFGVLAGGIAGSWAYTILIPDPAKMLITDEWPAPAVLQWKAVAEVFAVGIEKMPPGSLSAIAWAAALGLLLPILEKSSPAKLKTWIPSAPSLGLALVIPPYNSLSMFIGGLAAWIAAKVAKTWAARFTIVLAAGLIAGESLTGMAIAVVKMFSGK